MQNFIIEKLQVEATDVELLCWWNEYDRNNAGESQIFESLDEWEDHLNESCVSFAYRVAYGDVGSFGDSFFWLNGYGNFVSGNSLSAGESPIDFERLAEWLIEQKAHYISDWIEEWYEIEE